MFGDKPGNIFWNMIQKENEKKKNKKESSSKNLTFETKGKRGSLFIEQQFNQYGKKEDPMKLIEKLPTYSKISILQGLLKEMTSIKERFEENKNNMLEKIKQNCYNYYKSIIGMKEVYDYCESNSPEKQLNYILVENSKEKLGEKYDIIYKFLFQLRNNNDLMLNIIKNCPPNSYDQLSDFLVNFFYENTQDSSFNEEELMTIIYLIIEDFIYNKLPQNISIVENKNDNYLNTSILYHMFKSLTRKVDVRNFTCSVLSESLLKLESYKDSFSIEIKIIIDDFMQDQNSQFNKNLLNSISKKGTNPSFDEASTSLSYEYSKTFSAPDISNSIILSKGEDILNYGDIPDIEEKLDLENIEINSCFTENEVTLNYLKEKLSEYSQKNSKNNVIIAMKEYLNIQVNLIESEKNEIFSNSSKIKSLKIYTALNSKENSDSLIDIILQNYKLITNYINEILIKLKENITSLPYILKTITNILQILLANKYSKENLENMEYQKFMLLSNFLIGNIILPLVLNPDFNGIITTDVISKKTKDNLEIISKILYKILSGKLFSNKNESEYTIFNKFIIDTLPKIFDIVNCLNNQKNFILSKSIQKLIGTTNSIGSTSRDINYDYFKENQENIQQQSICFSWLDLFILSNLVKIFKESNNETYKKYSKIFDEFIEKEDYFKEQNFNGILSSQRDFFLFEKINYSIEFKKEMENILEDNYLSLKPNKDKEGDEDEILLFKKCLVEVLSYINKLHKESFNYFVQKNHEIIIKDNDIFLLLLNEEINNKYKEIEFEGDESHKNNDDNNDDIDVLKQFHNKNVVHLKGLEEDENEDADFKDVIFPQIIDTVKYELGHNLDTVKAKRIVFSSSYLQIHIDDLPKKYKENNYCLLIMEIIKKHESIINELNFSIINQFYLKVRGGEKLNMIITSNYLQIKKFEKVICIEYLFDKLDLPCKIIVKRDGMGMITKVLYEPVESGNSAIHSIQSFIDAFPDMRKFEKKVEDIIDLEETIELDVALNAYFKDLRGLMKNQEIIKRFPHEEIENISYELENYILFKLYEKLFPGESTKKDKAFHKKCWRLDFVKPENLIKDKKMINEKLWKASMDLIEEMDKKFTPADKVKNFGKAFSILQNSITFCSGKNDLGIDDTISSLIYVLLKSKPRNIFSNSKYCQLFLNPDLSKKHYGILLSQIEMVKNIIFDMKHSDLIGVSEEMFGKDEE